MNRTLLTVMSLLVATSSNADDVYLPSYEYKLETPVKFCYVWDMRGGEDSSFRIEVPAPCDGLKVTTLFGAISLGYPVCSRIEMKDGYTITVCEPNHSWPDK